MSGVNFGIQKDETFNDVKTRSGLEFPSRVLATTPVKPMGSVIYDEITQLPYYSDGLRWLSFSGLGVNEFIFTTSLTPDNAGIFTDWSLLYAQVQAVASLPIIIYVDAIFSSPAVITAGSYDLSGVRFQALHLHDGQQDNIRIVDGVTIDNAFFWEDISVDFATTTSTVMTLPFTGQTGFSSLGLVRSSFFSLTSTTPPIRVTGSSNIQLNKSTLQSFGGAGPLVTIDAGSVLGINASGQCIILDNNITGAGTCTISMDTTLFLDRTTQTVATLTIFEARTYEKATPADWVGAPTPISYKDAVDRLAAVVAANFGPIP